MKKLISLAASAALLLGTAGAAFAFFPFFQGSDVYVKNASEVEQDTTAVAKSDSGDNVLNTSGKLITGDATSIAESAAYANYFTTKIMGSICGTCVKELTVRNWAEAEQDTTAIAKADSGDNVLNGTKSWWHPSTGLIVTGDASSMAGSEAWANVFTTKIGSWIH